MQRISSKLAPFALALVAMTAYCDTALAEHWVSPNGDVQMSDGPRVSQLEKAFWVCDYVATTRGIHATHTDLCSTVTDELRKEKFGGSYQQMIDWWQQNKPAEHEKVAAGTAPR